MIGFLSLVFAENLPIDSAINPLVPVLAHTYWLSVHVMTIMLSYSALAVGMVHGLAGSAAVMLLVLSASRTVWKGVAFILLFGLGSIAGMMAIGTVISLPLMLPASRGRFMGLIVRGLACLGSLYLGISILAH